MRKRTRISAIAVAMVAWGFSVPAAWPATALPPHVTEIEGVKVLRLVGTREERAAQHGAFVRGRVRETALPYFAGKMAHSVRQTYIIQDVPFFFPIVMAALDGAIFYPLRESIPGDDRRVLQAFARASGFALKHAYDAHTIPDVGQWFVAQIFRGGSIWGGAFQPFPSALGCSSFIVSEEGGAEGGLIHARNLDYDSFTLFDSLPTALYSLPSEPDELATLSLTSLGIHTAGITAMNEAGLTLTLHQTMIDEVSNTAMPILSLNDRVIRRARTLDQALEMLRGARTAGSWKIILSSAREGRAASVEISAGGSEIIEMKDGRLAETNHVRSERMRRKEFSVNYQYYEDTRLRLRAIERSLARLPRVGVSEAVDLISSEEVFPNDPSGEPVSQSHHGIVSKMNNIQSVVFQPTQKQVWLAVPPIAGAKPLQGDYVALPTPDRLREWSDESAWQAGLESMRERRTRTQPYSPTRVQAHAVYRQGAALAMDHAKYDEAIVKIREAAKLEPEVGLYPLMEGMTAFRLAARGNDSRKREWIAQARPAFERALGLQTTDYSRSLVELFLARIDDLQGRRAQALEHYGRVNLGISRILDEHARKGLREKYGWGGIKTVVPDYVHGDAMRF